MLNFYVNLYFRFNKGIAYDDVEGIFTFGGSENVPAFEGYIGQVTVYRNRIVPAKKVRNNYIFSLFSEFYLVSTDFFLFPLPFIHLFLYIYLHFFRFISNYSILLGS